VDRGKKDSRGVMAGAPADMDSMSIAAARVAAIDDVPDQRRSGFAGRGS
jgi:hypothetical protein